MSDNNNTMKPNHAIEDTGYDFMKDCKLNNRSKDKQAKAVVTYQEIHPKIIEIDPHFAKEVERKITKFDLIQRQAQQRAKQRRNSGGTTETKGIGTQNDLSHLNSGSVDIETSNPKSQFRATNSFIMDGNQINKQIVSDIKSAVVKQQNIDENIILRPAKDKQILPLKIHDVGQNKIVIPQSQLNNQGALNAIKVYVNGAKGPFKTPVKLNNHLKYRLYKAVNHMYSTRGLDDQNPMLQTEERISLSRKKDIEAHHEESAKEHQKLQL